VCAAHDAAFAREHALRIKAESERDAVVSSTSWRMAALLQWAVERLRRLRSW